jgi:AIPR protein
VTRYPDTRLFGLESCLGSSPRSSINPKTQQKLTVDETKQELALNGMSVVNGCQSLTTIRACSEKAKSAANSQVQVLFRFYEIPQKDLADKISIYTNSQSAVKARDLRSNDKRVIAIKRAYEARYPHGIFIAKRGEERPADKAQDQTVDIVDLARSLAAWHLRMPIIAGNENRLFDKYFEQLFRTDYPAEDINALNCWSQKIDALWNSGTLNLNDQLLATRAQAKHQLLYAVQLSFFQQASSSTKFPNLLQHCQPLRQLPRRS